MRQRLRGGQGGQPSCSPDLLFLDVQMPKLDGFEVLELLGRERAGHLHDGLRPVRAARVRGARGRLPAEAVQRGALRRGAVARAGAAAGARRCRRRGRRHARRRGAAADRARSSGCSSATARRSTCCRSTGSTTSRRRTTTSCFKSEGKQYLKDQTLAAVEAPLDPARFVRIHRSYLLNIERIARVELYAKDSRVAILRDGTRLPVSRAGYARLSKLL